MVAVSGERRTSLLGPGLSTFVGRERELEALTALLGSARLVTLVGPGGSGKTRLALETAQHIASADREVDVVELAALRDPALVPAVTAGSLGLRATGSEPPFDLLVRHIGATDRLLILDNLEQLLPAAAERLAELLARCPGLRLLVTSRVPSNLRAEHVLRVEPLPVPEAEADPEGLADVPSVALFTERARVTGRALALDGAEAPTIGAICRRLDGLPLALELAAARLRLLSPAALLARLEEGLGVLAGGPLDAEERHRTLRDTIAWSVALLPARERALFVRLGVFRGGFDLRAALAVAAPGIVDCEDELLELLGSLADHSLVRVIPALEAQPRFGMLETIRDYAREHLENEPTLRDRQLAYHLVQAEEADLALNGPGHVTAARRLGTDIENLRSALAWSDRSGDRTGLLRLAAALGLYWRLHGDIRDGRDWLERAISLAPTGDPVLAKALVGLAWIVIVLGDQRRGGELAGTALQLAQAAGDERTAGRAHVCIAAVLADVGRLDEAMADLESVLETGRRLDDATLLCEALILGGNVARERADYERARAWYEEAGTVARKAGDATSLGLQLHNLGMLVRQMGDPRRALSLLTESAQVLEAVDDLDGQGWAVLSLAWALADLGRLVASRAAIREGLALGARTASPDTQLHGLGAIAVWLGAAGQPLAALRAWAAHRRGRIQIDRPYGAFDRARIEPLVARDRRAAGEPQASLAWAEGQAMDLEAALSAALRAMDAVDLAQRSSRPLDPRGASLTTREIEVLALVGDGCSDGEIAERLFISKKTASVHVANIKDKLATENRVETALAAVRMGLMERVV
jgi:predicted ATPase/DNA-binding CsgD family transcriptional regulator